MAVRYERLTAVLIEAMKEQQAQIEELRRALNMAEPAVLSAEEEK